jgi:adenosylhomocysteine nucleosidase
MATLLIMALPEESQMVFEKNGHKPYYCGIGQTKAAFWTQKLIADLKPDQVINLGTAGSHSFKQGDLVECTSFIQRPANNFIPISSKSLKIDSCTELPKVICGTGDFIETGKPLVQCDVMDMEAYAMAYVCKQLNVKFTSVKYVSDNSDQNMLNHWHSCLQDAATKLFNEYQKLI